MEHQEDHTDLRRLFSVHAQTVRTHKPQKNKIQNQVVINTCLCSFTSLQFYSAENVSSFKIKLVHICQDQTTNHIYIFFFEVSFIHNDLHCIVQEEIMLQLSNDSLGTDLLWE